MENDYDVQAFSDGNGEVYLGSDRSASWKRINSGLIQVYLEDKGGAFKAVATQGDKAIDACRVWVEGNEISASLRDVTQIKARL